MKYKYVTVIRNCGHEEIIIIPKKGFREQELHVSYAKASLCNKCAGRSKPDFRVEEEKREKAR